MPGHKLHMTGLLLLAGLFIVYKHHYAKEKIFDNFWLIFVGSKI